MSGPVFTVMIPSHDHGNLLLSSGRSALRQTLGEIEVFIVLDGPNDPTRRAAAALADGDPRVRVFEFPKGERVGEAHRAEAMETARGRLVAYLSDDDLWYPHHLEHIAEMHAEHDFVAAQAVVHAAEAVLTRPGDLAHPFFRNRLLEEPRFNFIGLSQGSHTLEAYRSLDRGWHPAPDGVWSDLHMWRQFLEVPGLRARSATDTTLSMFPSPARREMSLAERDAELVRWLELTADRRRIDEFLATVVTASLRGTATREATRAMRLGTDAARLEAELESVTEAARAAQEELDDVRAQLDAVRSSLAYSAARRVAATPIIGPAARWLAGRIWGRR